MISMIFSVLFLFSRPFGPNVRAIATIARTMAAFSLCAIPPNRRWLNHSTADSGCECNWTRCSISAYASCLKVIHWGSHIKWKRRRDLTYPDSWTLPLGHGQAARHMKWSETSIFLGDGWLLLDLRALIDSTIKDTNTWVNQRLSVVSLQEPKFHLTGPKSKWFCLLMSRAKSHWTSQSTWTEGNVYQYILKCKDESYL